MALTIRKTEAAVLAALVAAHNAFIVACVNESTTFPHYDVTSTTSGDFSAPVSSPLLVTATAPATTLGMVITLAENARTILLAHFADALAHQAADATNLALITVGAVPTAVDQGTVNTLLNALQTAYNAHRTQGGVHPHNDTTNVSSAAAASSLVTSETLGADLKTQINAHEQFAPGSVLLNVVAA